MWLRSRVADRAEEKQVPGRIRRPVARPPARPPGLPPRDSKPAAPGMGDTSRSNEEAVAQLPTQRASLEVKRGDTLWGLAARHLGNGGRWQELAQENGLKAPYTLVPGQTLVLPSTGDKAPKADVPAAPLQAPATGDATTERDEAERLRQRTLSEQETPISKLGTLGRGTKGDAGKWIQSQLVQHGADIQVDGAFGVKTEDMVRAFQFANGIAVTGKVDRLTGGLLASPTAKGIDQARLADVPGIAIGKFDTYDAGKKTGETDVVLLDGVRLAAWMVPHWVKMRDAASADGVRLQFNSSRSGFRTPQDQADLYRRYGSPRAVAPGWSNHQDGHAIDLVMTPDVKAWMARRAGEFGFVRPTYEDWHWEYRG